MTNINNIVVEDARLFGAAALAHAKILPKLAEFVTVMARVHQDLTFVCQYPYKVVVRGTMGNERGSISLETAMNRKNESYHRYVLHNRAIDRDMIRGHSMKAREMKQAVKIFETYFKDLPLHTVAAERSAPAVANVQSMFQRHTEAVVTFIRQKMQTQPSVISSALHDVYDFGEFNNVESTLSKLKASGMYVCITGSQYLVCPLDATLRPTTDTKFCTSDELPYVVRQNLGMLKLVPDRHLIANCGYRQTAESFLVITEECNNG
jgi:hypothetical protein